MFFVQKRPANVPGTLLINFGDLLRDWTGGLYQSTLHRVRTNENNSPRHSIVFFSDVKTI